MSGDSGGKGSGATMAMMVEVTDNSKDDGGSGTGIGNNDGRGDDIGNDHGVGVSDSNGNDHGDGNDVGDGWCWLW